MTGSTAQRTLTGRRPHLAVVLVGALGLIGGCTADDAPQAPGTPDVTAPAPTPGLGTPSVTDGPSMPTSTPTSTPPATSRPDVPPTLHVGGAVADFPAGAPEAEVVPYLTDTLGAEPEVTDPDVACVTSALPGRRLVWEGLTVLVRTTDETDADVEPYVAGWALDERTGTSALGPLTTAEGVGLGDPERAVSAAYPNGEAFDTPDPGVTLWALGAGTAPHTDDLTVRLTDGVVTTISGGLGCGD